ncbi:Helix-turn-helix domain protein [Collinsella aerofaciens]|nr:Helix-turn-helix domain protein [Collinsella aerofaciens]
MDGTELNRLHRRLKRALTAKGISQRELGRRIGATQASVSLYMNGKRLPGPAALFKICRELDISADWLLGLKRRESDMDRNDWTSEGDVAFRTVDGCSLVARIEKVEDGSFELGILEGDTCCELFARRFDSMDEARGHADGVLDRKPQRDKSVAFIEVGLDGLLGPNISDEDYLASASLDRDTMRELVVRALPICTGPDSQEVAVTFSIAGPDGIEMETEQESAALEQATERAVFLSGVWSVYAAPGDVVAAVKGLISSLAKAYPSLVR